MMLMLTTAIKPASSMPKRAMPGSTLCSVKRLVCKRSANVFVTGARYVTCATRFVFSRYAHTENRKDAAHRDCALARYTPDVRVVRSSVGSRGGRTGAPHASDHRAHCAAHTAASDADAAAAAHTAARSSAAHRSATAACSGQARA